MGGKRHTGVRKVSASTIEISFTYHGVRRREPVKLEPTNENLKRMAQRRQAILYAINEGTFDYATEFPKSKWGREAGNTEKVADLLEAWYEQRKGGWKASTRAAMRAIIIGQLKPHFGELFLHELRWKHVMAYGDACPNVKSKTMSTRLIGLRQICKDGMGKETITVNPLEGRVLYRHKEPAGAKLRRVDPLSLAERDAVLSACTNEQVYNRILFGLWTGLRPCEIAALAWSDIDFINNQVHVSKSLTRWAKEPEDPKTVKGIRSVPIMPDAMKALLSQKKHTFMLKKRVFHDPIKNLPWTGDDTFRKQFWAPLLAKAGVRYRAMRQIRHTFASSMFMAGENPMWIAEVMGHEDWAFTAKTYSRYMPASETSAGSKAVGMFSSDSLSKTSRKESAEDG